jgi:hypothetical protein
MSTENKMEIYRTADGQTDIQVRLESDTVWLNRQQLAELFGRDIKTIGKHIGNVFTDGELARNSVVANFATTAADGKTYQVEHYNLDVIISVGYRVKSQQGTQFRIWATQRLREYLVQGYSINSARFEKNAVELEQALALIRKAAHLLYFVVKNHPFQTATSAAVPFCLWIFCIAMAACSMRRAIL